MKKQRDWILFLEIAVNIRIKQMLVATDHFMPVERKYCKAGLVLCLGYVPVKHHAKQTCNFYLQKCISWGFGD